MTAEEIAEVRLALSKISSGGSWQALGGIFIRCDDGGRIIKCWRDEDRSFVLAAPGLIRKLLAEVERLQGANQSP